MLDDVSPPNDSTIPPRSSGVMLRGEGRVSVGRRGPSVLVSRLVGLLEPLHVEWLVAELDRHMIDHVWVVFIDAERLQSCTPSLAEILETWTGRHRSGLRRVHMLGGTASVDSQIARVARVLGELLTHHTESRHFRSSMLELIESTA